MEGTTKMISVKKLYCSFCDVTYPNNLENRDMINDCRKKNHTLVEMLPDKTVQEIMRPETKMFEYAEIIMKDFDFKTLSDTHEILYYEGGVYVLNGETLIAEECEKLIPECSRYKVNEITAIIQRRTFTDRELFDSDLNILNLKNGLFNLETSELKEHTKDYPSRIQIPIKYNPEAQPTKILEFLNQCLPDEKDIENLLQMAGKILTKNNPKLEKACLCTGGGNNGKSTWFDILGTLFGDTVSNVTLHDITDNGYYVAELDGKLLNYRADISNREIEQAAQFNEVISGDYIQARKIYGKPFRFKPIATHFFSANQPPEFKDDTDALWRRFVIVDFPQQFVVNPTEGDLEGGVIKADTSLIKKLTIEEELSGLFNILIKKAKRIRELGRIEFAQRTEEIRDIMKIKSNPIQAYSNECLIISKDGKLPKSTVYASYQQWAEINKKTILPDRKFNVKLKECLPITGDQKDRFPDLKSPVSSWRGIIFSKNVPDVPNVPDDNISKQQSLFSKEDTESGTSGTLEQ